MNKSETERAIEQAYSIFKSSLQSILNVEDLRVEVDVIGVKLSTLASIVEENESLELITIESGGFRNNITRNYVSLGNIDLENEKVND